MNFFTGITTENGLKKEFRRLVKTHHPDMGGNKYVMQKLVDEYKRRVILLQGNRNTDFSQVKVGDRVYVNGTSCTVITVHDKTFVAKADGRTKRATFSRVDGICVTNEKYKAYYK